MTRQYTGVSARVNAKDDGTGRIALPDMSAPFSCLRIFPQQSDAQGYTRVAFGTDNTVKVPTIELPAFTVPNNRETIITVPTNATWIAAQGNSTVLLDVMLDLPAPPPPA